MTQENEIAGPQSVPVCPRVFACYGHGWRQMWKYILELLLITIVSVLLSLPYAFLDEKKLAPRSWIIFR